MSLAGAPLAGRPLADRAPAQTVSVALAWAFAVGTIGHVSESTAEATAIGSITGTPKWEFVGHAYAIGTITPPPTLGVSVANASGIGTITGLLRATSEAEATAIPYITLGRLLGESIADAYAVGTIGAPDGYGLPTQVALAWAYAIGTINEATATDVWVANNGAFSQYTHYPFRSYARVNGSMLACDDRGVYRLGGELADGQQISAQIMTGLVQPGGTQLAMVDAIIATLEAGNDESIEMVVRREYNGQLVEDVYRPQAMDAEAFRELRAKVKRGPRAKYWAFGVRNRYGRYFELDSLLVNAAPSLRQRK